MVDKLDKKNWYDGWIYAKIIDTQPIPFRYKILNYLKSNHSVLDIGCGTGAFTAEIARKCKHVTGVDISKKQIIQANNRLKNSNLNNLKFFHLNALNISKELDNKFDYAVFTFMLHEINHSDRIKLLKEISNVVNGIIVIEFNIPQPLNIWGIINRTIEFLAGKNHFTNFLDFKKRGGINEILTEAGFKITEEKINQKKVFKIVVANK